VSSSRARRGEFGVDLVADVDPQLEGEARSRPLIERVHRMIGDLAGRVTPKSPLGKAVSYAVNQWSTLVVFLDDPRVPLSNRTSSASSAVPPSAVGISCSQDPMTRRAGSRSCTP
jgi:transposase